MPAYPYLFEVKKGAAQPGEVALTLPPGAAKPGEVVVAKPEALALVSYLISLDRTYTPLAALPASSPASSPASGAKP